jgi:hypothetical protein
MATKSGLAIRDLHFFTVGQLIDYSTYYLENEQSLMGKKTNSKSSKTFTGSQGVIDFLRC